MPTIVMRTIRICNKKPIMALHPLHPDASNTPPSRPATRLGHGGVNGVASGCARAPDGKGVVPAGGHATRRARMPWPERRRRLRCLGAWLLALAGLGAACSAAATPVIPRIDEAPSLFAPPESAAWADALVIDDFTQVDPVQGGQPRFPIVVRLLRDARTLYVAARLSDAQPQALIANELLRDASLDADDLFRLVIDPQGRGQEGYLFEVNPRGARRDALLEGDRSVRYDWDGRWRAEAGVDAQGWWVVLAIPFETMSYDSGRGVWGFNFERTLRRQQERSRWRNINPAVTVAAVSGTAPLAGLDDIPVPTPWTLIPNLRLATDSGPERLRPRPVQVGLDASRRIGSGLQLALTLNTDFAQADVDEVEVNLTQFPLFVPEKRAFFLRDSSYFRFGDIDYSPFPFFSRRIGLDGRGNPLGLQAGVKLTGREGPWSLGALGVQVEQGLDTPARTLGVLRVARQFGPHWTAGGIVTEGEPRAEGRNRMSGIDASWVRREAGLPRIEWRGWAMHTHSTLAGGDDHAWGLELRLPNEPWSVYQYLGRVGERFDPGLGFVSRRGIFEFVHSTRYRWRLAAGRVRYVDKVFDAYVVSDLRGRVRSSSVDLPEVFVQLHSGASLFFKVAHVREVLDEPFAIRPAIAIAAGDWRWRQTVLELKSPPASRLVGSIVLRHGGFYDGRRTDVGGKLSWRPLPGVLLDARAERREVALQQGNFRVDLVGLTARWSLSPRLSLSGTGQYDNVSGLLGLNARLRWIVGDDNNFFFVYNRRQDLDAPGRPVLLRSATTKIEWAVGF
jgi:hypothetical protein